MEHFTLCGIVGLALASQQRPPDMGRSLRALAHRGPDGSGTYVDDHFAFGHTRLAIIDLSETGAQPMRSANGRYVMTYNGEIYNFAELKQVLRARGVTFRGTSDSEVLLEGYSQLGPKVLDHLNGIFAFVGVYLFVR